MMSNVDRAEHKSRARTICMALLAAVTVFTSTFGFDNPANDGASFRGGSWLVTIALAVAIIATGGGLNLNRQLRTLMNDELSRENRRRALALGFYTAMLVTMVLYVASWSVPIELRAALRLVSGLGVAAVLARYAMLEWL
jgi:protein-S-isoprenylcysteine O-methyltransferase Ste14